MKMLRFAPFTTRSVSFTLALLTLGLLGPASASALDDAHYAQAQEVIHKAITYLRSTQNGDGSWSPQPGPAVTAMIVQGMLSRPDISPADPAMHKAIDFILTKTKDDGGIHDGFLENYNTAIALSALANVTGRPDAAIAVAKAQNYLRTLQWSDQKLPGSETTVDKSHPFYGGAGYGNHGRPDMSNTQFMIEGLHESGLDCNDPAFQRAMVFISRCQASNANDSDIRKQLSNDGGFIYATSTDKDHIGVPETKAGTQTIDTPDQGPVTVLRSYGSMTYAGFKSYLYANLDRDDPRVTDALKWIKNNYAVDRNPGMPENVAQQGHYYYLVAFARAFKAWGRPTLTTQDGQERDWANDLIDQLAKTQREDGSWTNEADRWMEGDTNLTTAYALLALTAAVK